VPALARLGEIWRAQDGHAVAAAAATPPGARTVEVMSTTDQLLTIDEVAEWLRISKTGVRRLVDRREIRHLRVGRQIRFMRRDIADYLAAQVVEPLNLGEELLRAGIGLD
jgi:excisionase family DNA binding protein